MGDAPSDGHPPTILLDTQCDSWSDPNATIYYKAAYPDDENIILLPSSLSGDIVHGLVQNQVQNLNDLIVYYFKPPKNKDKLTQLTLIKNKINYPEKLPLIAPPSKYTCIAVGLAPKCKPDSNGAFDTLKSCQEKCGSPPPPPSKYSCKTISHPTSKNECVSDPSGEYKSLEDCESNCTNVVK